MKTSESYQVQQQETPREYYKRHGICPKCKKRKAFGLFVHCEVCLEEIRINNLKYSDRRSEYNKKHNENKRIQYNERKEEGLCTVCGKKKATNGQLCTECYRKRLLRRRVNEYSGRAYGEAFRERMDAGLCMYCGKPQVEGYKFCAEHLEAKRKIVKKAMTNNEAFRRENNLFWEKKDLKNSKNG